VGIELYWRTGADEEKHTCPRCGAPFLPVRFIHDLKQTLHAVGEDYCVPPATMSPAEFARLPAEKLPTSVTWWQDFCPECKRVMRAEATLGALGSGGNKFL
jgi:ribosomal protein S27AE